MFEVLLDERAASADARRDAHSELKLPCANSTSSSSTCTHGLQDANAAAEAGSDPEGQEEYSERVSARSCRGSLLT